MGCIKANKEIQINKIESIKNNELEQKKLILTHVSSSQCGESEASSKNLLIKNKNDNDIIDNDNYNIIISEDGEKSESNESKKDSPKEKSKD